MDRSVIGGSLEKDFPVVARLMVVIPYALASVVLLGWGVDSELLKRAGMGAVTMNPASAIAFLLLSLGLFLRMLGGKPTAVLGPVLVAGAGLMGALKLCDLAVGTHIGIDTIAFASQLSGHYLRPSRMAPNTALAFVMISLALSIMWHRSGRAVVTAQILAFATSVISIFAVVGYLYGVGALYSIAAFHPMALHAAVGFLCLSGYVFIETAERGLMIPISDRGPAGHGSRALLPAAIAIPVAFGWLRQQGEAGGLFQPEIGVALMVIATMVTMVVLIWQNARWLLAADGLRCRAEAAVAHMALHDHLTGLPNRGNFMDRLIARMETRDRRRPDLSFAILYMDLDGFKQVNDRFGHSAGDALLREVGKHLGQCSMRREDLVARVGGDEFAMILEGISCAAEAETVAGRIVAEMPSSFGPAGREVRIGMSIGIALASLLNQTPEALINDADRALYQAKREGKGRFVLSPAVPSAGFYDLAELQAA